VAALAVVAALAGCGGRAAATGQTVVGQGYRFQAPLGWRLRPGAETVAAWSGAVDVVEVTHYPLERAYRPARARAADRELEADVERLAANVRGRVVDRSGVVIGGAATTMYRVVFGQGTTLEIAFFLRGSDEYELSCQRRSSDPDGPCSQLFSSFAPD
jgi:hypothetical protein